jgi:hypothetical protein
MLKFDFKSVCVSEPLLQRSKKVFVAFYGCPAIGADQMVMMSVFGMVIDKTVVLFTADNTIVLFKKFKSAVDG